MNDYLTTENGTPYPVVVQSKLDEIDTSKFVNVMDYGATGDGITWDDDAIEDAFNNAKYGVIFPSGKTFLVHKLTTIHIKKRDMTVYAYGATIKMDDFCRYSFLSIEYEEDSYHGTVIWLGGKLWGNKKNQSWPGSPTGKNAWEEDHGRFLGICYAEFALVKDVAVVGTVMDGVGLESCKLAVISDSKGWGGAPIKYEEVQDQGTYFKCTRTGSQAFYCINLNCNGGCIGVHYSTPYVEDNSLTVINNCHFLNQIQNALHFEDCTKVFLYNSSVSNDITQGFTGDVHISNSTQIASIKDCQFTNSKVDFVNASDLQIGVVDSCQFISEYKDGDSASVYTCLAGATHCINSSFTGTTDIEQAWVDNVQNCDFSNFNSLALRGPHVATSSHFANGPDPISPARDGVVVNCTYDNVGDSTYRSPVNTNWQLPFTSSITILSDDYKFLGLISCGSIDGGGILTSAANGKTNAVTGVNADAKASFASKRSISINNNMSKGNNMNVATSSERNTSQAALSNNVLPAEVIKLYPNPAVEMLHISLNNQVWGKTILTIYDEQGRLVQNKTIDKNVAASVETMNVHSLTSGSYILQISNQHQQTSLKFVIAR